MKTLKHGSVPPALVELIRSVGLERDWPDERIAEFWNVRVADWDSITHHQVAKIRRDLGLNRAEISKSPAPNCPTPEQIRQRCAAIQATWSEYEEQRHRTIHATDWTPNQWW
jgi:hypothetical protein